MIVDYNNPIRVNYCNLNQPEYLMSELEDYYYIRIKALEKEVERLQAKIDSTIKVGEEVLTNN
tara:strand:- start:10404 stop:10592 length:189 start_codon:yes stop_codon:yes gene_type:complete